MSAVTTSLLLVLLALGKQLLSAEDDAIKTGGKIGLWTKADSFTAFDDPIVQPLERR